MIQTAISTITIFSLLSLSSLGGVSTQPEKVKIAEQKISLNKRVLGNEYLNSVYKDNILLNMAYMRGLVSKDTHINWDEVRKNFEYEFDLEPNERFAYHDATGAEYSENVVKITSSHFNAQEGYKTDGYLYGMGVCHLASLINWTAKDGGLESIAPSNHDFYPIPEVSREHGVAIYSHPDSKRISELQNLYIKNTLGKTVTFRFEFDGDNLKVQVLKSF